MYNFRDRSFSNRIWFSFRRFIVMFDASIRARFYVKGQSHASRVLLHKRHKIDLLYFAGALIIVLSIAKQILAVLVER